MNIYDEQEFVNSIKTLSTGSIEILYKWLREKESEKDRKEKLLIMKIELRSRRKRENQI